jgi:hypothetical protein
MVQRTIQLLLTQRPVSAALRMAVKKLWPLPAGVIGSVALAAFVNPFGLISLTFPFAILAPAWQKLHEWQPLLSNTPFGTTWEFFIAIGILGGLLLFRLAGIPGVPASFLRRPTLEQVFQTLFDLTLAGVVIYMTFKARRFVPLAVIVMAPFLAMQIQWLAGLLARVHRMLGIAFLGAAGIALVVPLLMHANALRWYYDSNNPLYPSQSVFERMSGIGKQPVEAAEFLAANRIKGRVFNEWRWEGYLHWRCPDVKVFLGGRAHLVYDPATDALSTRILADARQFPDPRYHVNPTKDLADTGVHLVVIPSSEDAYSGLLWHLVERPGATWGFLYFDGKDVVLADAAWPETAELLRRAADGELVYPSTATAALSKAMAMTTPLMKRPLGEQLEAFIAAAAAKPSPFAYNVIRQISRVWTDGPPWQKSYFRQEYARLESMNYRQADGARVVLMRAQVASFLWDLYSKEGATQEAARWAKARDEAAVILKDLGAVVVPRP